MRNCNKASVWLRRWLSTDTSDRMIRPAHCRGVSFRLSVTRLSRKSRFAEHHVRRLKNRRSERARQDPIPLHSFTKELYPEMPPHRLPIRCTLPRKRATVSFRLARRSSERPFRTSATDDYCIRLRVGPIRYACSQGVRLQAPRRRSIGRTHIRNHSQHIYAASMRHFHR